MAVLARTTDMAQEDRDRLQMVKDAWDAAEPMHRRYRNQWDSWFALHRNHRRLVTAHAAASGEADRDAVMGDARREWGAELFIPYVYTIVETILARILMNEPKMTCRGLRPNVPLEALQGVKHLFERRQDEISYSMILLPSTKRGLEFGLGVQKTYWDQDVRQRVVVERGIFGQRKTSTQKVLLSEGPMADDVDIWDFRWDPGGTNVRSCDWMIHRTWRNMKYIAERVSMGEWAELDLKAVEGMGSETDHGDVWKERMDAAGVSDYDTRRGRQHEVWEYHDGDQVITILDKQLVVQAKPTPFFHRELPFQIFRPIHREGEFVGGGVIEPIAHLQYELNTMRSQRRDNATLVLQKPFVYTEGLLDPADLIIGPAVGIPVLGPPRDVIQPLEFPDIPASGYREEQSLKEDIERTAGISEVLSGGSGQTGATDTATGVQLIQAAANERIKILAKSLIYEMVKAGASQWLELYRQRLQMNTPVQVPDQTAETGTRFVTVGPEHVNQPMEVLPVLGSTEPDNLPQRRNDAMTFYNLFRASGVVDQRALTRYVFDEYDVPDPDSFLTPPGLDPAALQRVGMALQQQGIPPDKILAAIRGVLASQSQNGAATPVAAPQGEEQ